MRINLHSLTFGFLAIALFVGTSAKADTVDVSVWENGITNLQSTPPPGSTIYGTTPTVTAVITNSNPLNLFSFTSGTDLSLNGFLTAGGDGVVYSNNAKSGDSINQSVFLFTGEAELTAGTVYTFTKDDGMILVLNGTDTVINAGGATAAENESFSVATSGVYSFQLYYDETNGPPAVLTGNFGAAPEPSSFALLGSSLLGAAGMLRRRMKKA